MKPLITLTAILFLGCSSILLLEPRKIKFGSTVETIDNAGWVEVDYQSREYMVNDLIYKSKIRMWTPETTQNHISMVPSGGMVYITIKGLTMAHGNPANWEYIIQSMDGNTILREAGRNSAPNFRVSGGFVTWWSISGLWLEKKIEGPFRLFVLDNITDRRSEFVIYPNLQNPD